MGSSILNNMQYAGSVTTPKPSVSGFGAGVHTQASVTPTPRPAVTPQTTGATSNPMAGFSSLAKPQTPTSTVKQEDIKIPEFLKNTRK